MNLAKNGLKLKKLYLKRTKNLEKLPTADKNLEVGCEEKETFDITINVSETMYYVKAGWLWILWITSNLSMGKNVVSMVGICGLFWN